MKKIGIVALVIGLIGLIATLGLDTSVASGGDRVYNIGLINEKQNFLLIFIAIVIIGVVFLAVGGRNVKSHMDPIDPLLLAENLSFRTCPFCAENIKTQAIVCRYCGHDVKLLAEMPSKSPINQIIIAPTNIETLAIYLLKIENSIRLGYSWLKNIRWIATSVEKSSYFARELSLFLNILSILMILIGLASFVYVIIYRDFSLSGENATINQITFHIKNVIPIVLAGVLIFYRHKLPQPIAEKKEINKSKNTKLIFFGKPIDLIVIQLILIISIWTTYNNYYLRYLSCGLALAVMALGCLLIITKNKIFGIFGIVWGLYFIIFYYTKHNDYAYILEQASQNILDTSMFKVNYYFWLLLVSIALPTLQLVRLGNIQYGKIRGDCLFEIFDHTIFVPFASSLSLIIIWCGFLSAINFCYAMFAINFY